MDVIFSRGGCPDNEMPVGKYLAKLSSSTIDSLKMLLLPHDPFSPPSPQENLGVPTLGTGNFHIYTYIIIQGSPLFWFPGAYLLRSNSNPSVTTTKEIGAYSQESGPSYGFLPRCSYLSADRIVQTFFS